ncbi:PF11185 family protein, partial [Fusobacterium sp. CM21]
NPFWIKNMKGEFHLSVGSEFEDDNDCRPYMNKENIAKYLKEILCYLSGKTDEIDEAINQFNCEFNVENIDGIADNYRNDIRIGCFTKCFNNNKMWDKYGDNSKGFCIEYDVNKNKLFTSTVLPILYTENKYDLSLTYAAQIILEVRKQQKGTEEYLKKFGDILKKVLKTSYIPLFIKEPKWSFEEEYRMFILKHRNTPLGMLKMDKVLDENYNINLNDAIRGIYLGKRFEENKKADIILSKIRELSKENQVPVYKIMDDNNVNVIIKP